MEPMNDFMELDSRPDLVEKFISLSSEEYHQKTLADVQKLRNYIEILNRLENDGKWEDERFWQDIRGFVFRILDDIPFGVDDNIRNPLDKLVDIVHNSMKLMMSFSVGGDDWEPLISIAANHAGITPEYLLLLFRIIPKNATSGYYYSTPFLLQIVTSHDFDGVATDENRVGALKELVKLGLLEKEDVSRTRTNNINLLVDCDVRFTKVFDFLSSFDPDSLFTIWESFDDIEKTTQFLEAGFNHFPNIGGLLFQKQQQQLNDLIDNNMNCQCDKFLCPDSPILSIGELSISEESSDSIWIIRKIEPENSCKNQDGNTTVLDKAIEIYGEKKVTEILHKILSPKSDYPILHHIFSKAPQYADLFSEKFEYARGNLKDHNGRSLHQAVLAAGPMMVRKNAVLFTQLQDSQILEKDPITTLFPFAAMAAGEHGDLQKCFELLRRQPSVLETKARMMDCSLKRKREWVI